MRDEKETIQGLKPLKIESRAVMPSTSSLSPAYFILAFGTVLSG
jgi:hypothetical protein